MRKSSLLWVGFVAGACFLTNLACGADQAGRSEEAPAVAKRVRGKLRVSFRTPRAHGEGYHSSDSLQEYTGIDFHENYIVLYRKGGGGDVVPIARLTDFTWYEE